MAQAMQEQSATPSSVARTQPPVLRQGDHERLFRLLETEGPAPDAFMLYLSDPVLEQENIFEDFEDEDES
jgi:hypothetical protein